jgi:hypothetical protein
MIEATDYMTVSGLRDIQYSFGIIAVRVSEFRDIRFGLLQDLQLKVHCLSIQEHELHC